MSNISFIEDHLEKLKSIQIILLDYLNKDDLDESILQNIINHLENQNILSEKYEFKEFLHLIAKLAKNYNRKHNMILKIEQLLTKLFDNITNNFTNFEIFLIFKSNKIILLFLIEKQIVIPDKIISQFITSYKYKERFYPQYFYPEFKSFYSNDLLEKIKPEVEEAIGDDISLFNERRKIGENHHHICHLIRNDLVDDFIEYMGKNNLKLSTTIEHSMFETNYFLTKQEIQSCWFSERKKLIPYLIEYAAFHGSIQIFKYLCLNKVTMSSDLSILAIHGNNNELFHVLEEYEDKMDIESCLNESIRCHNTDLVEYFKNMDSIDENYMALQCIHCYNIISLFNINFKFTKDPEFLYLFYENDYLYIVDLLLKEENLKFRTINVL